MAQKVVGTSQYLHIKSNVAQILHSLGQTVLLEVPVEVADPLDVDGHDAPRDGQLGVVTPGRRHHVSWDDLNQNNKSILRILFLLLTILQPPPV